MLSSSLSSHAREAKKGMHGEGAPARKSSTNIRRPRSGIGGNQQHYIPHLKQVEDLQMLLAGLGVVIQAFS